MRNTRVRLQQARRYLDEMKAKVGSATDIGDEFFSFANALCSVQNLLPKEFASCPGFRQWFANETVRLPCKTARAKDGKKVYLNITGYQLLKDLRDENQHEQPIIPRWRSPQETPDGHWLLPDGARLRYLIKDGKFILKFVPGRYRLPEQGVDDAVGLCSRLLREVDQLVSRCERAFGVH